MAKTGVWLLFLLLCGFFTGPSRAASKQPGYETEYFRLGLSSRTPSQIAAFYTGRGFPHFAIDEVQKWCFITIGLHNKGKERVWLDLGNWHFHTPETELRRYSRADLSQRWQELGLEKRFQSTFRWTLMPEKLDFHPFEGEGGNIVLPRTGKPITITASIAVGDDKAKIYPVKIDSVFCASDP